MLHLSLLAAVILHLREEEALTVVLGESRRISTMLDILVVSLLECERFYG